VDYPATVGRTKYFLSRTNETRNEKGQFKKTRAFIDDENGMLQIFEPVSALGYAPGLKLIKQVVSVEDCVCHHFQ
jgi:hypothetical protein